MVRMVPAPICIAMYCLLQEFDQIAFEVERMRSAQVAALLKGEDIPYEAEVVTMVQNRDQIKCAAIAHQQEHG